MKEDKQEKIKALKAAWPHTIPVLTGFLFLGMAYGILMESKGFGILWILSISSIVFAGSIQYVAIAFLTSAFNPLYVFFMTLMINARHLFYGLSMLGPYKSLGKIKPYLIFALCDETFSIVCSVKPPKEVKPSLFYFFITFLNQSYWVLGSVLGGILGSFLTFNTKGLDFVLTALFAVIFMEQWKEKANRKASLVGLGASTFCLIIFGQEGFILPAMITIVLILTFLRKKEEPLSRIEEATD